MHGDRFTRIPTDGNQDPEGDGEPNRLVSIKNAARVLGGITPRQVYHMLDRRDLEAIKVGRRRMVVVESIDRYVESRRASSKEMAA